MWVKKGVYADDEAGIMSGGEDETDHTEVSFVGWHRRNLLL